MNANPDTSPDTRGGTTTAAPSPDPSPVWGIVAATAHRDVADEHVPWLTDALDYVAGRLYRDFGTRVALSGMARQGDLLWADAAVRAGMRLWACIPHDKQAARFPRADRAEWVRLRGLADKIWVAGEVPESTPPKQRSSAVNALIWKRNTAMVKAAEAVVGVWDGRLTGGTHGTLIQAAKLDRPGVWIHPTERKTVGRLPTLAELEPFVVCHARCGHVRLVALRADADRELARLEAANFRTWKIRRAKPREDDSVACTTCYIHPPYLEPAGEDLGGLATESATETATQEALL